LPSEATLGDPLPRDADRAALVGRVWRDDLGGPSLVAIRGGRAFDITSRALPTMRDLLEQDDPATALRAAEGEDLGDISGLRLLAPADLQAIKACGVTFADSLLERVIEEMADGDPSRANDLRAGLSDRLGVDLGTIRPGSAEAEALKATLVARGVWSQYMEVGLGPDAEVFTKAQPMSAVGHGAEIGILRASAWNNPEPEIVLAVDSRSRIVGATLGNDVNLRDIEGRSALLLGRAKDNTASAAIGPFIRLFDADFTLDDIRRAEVMLDVVGADGFHMTGRSSMTRISRDPADLVSAAMGAHHQYPDGMMLYLGTMFAPVQDRDTPGMGFTHHSGDRVTIASPTLGRLVNTVRHAEDCAPWRFGTADLMRNLARRRLL